MLPLTPTVQIPSHDGSIKKLTWHQDHTMCATGTANKELPILLQFAIKKYNSFRSPLAFIANSTIISKSWLRIQASISNITIYCCPNAQNTTPNGGALLAPTKALSPSLVQSLIYTSKSSSHTKYVSKSASIATRQYKTLSPSLPLSLLDTTKTLLLSLPQSMLDTSTNIVSISAIIVA